MTRIFISGPISGIPNYNKEAFDAVELELKEAGYETFNPQSIVKPTEEELEQWMADWDNGLAKHPVERLWRHCMKICVGQIPLCDEMRMLPHWQNSQGAVWEHKIAFFLGLKITYCPVV